MKHIKTFSEHLNESYLNGSRQPLYHWTRSLEYVIQSNLLKTSIPAYGYDGGSDGNYIKSISLSRSRYYSLDSYGSIRLVFDGDKLRNDGYINKSFDELAFAKIKNRKNKNIVSKTIDTILNPKKKQFLHKGDFSNKNRMPVNNISGLERDIKNGLEIEYEERIYKPIKNVGKYLLAIEFVSETNLNTYLKRVDFLNFLDSYPQIEVRLIDKDKLWKYGIPVKADPISSF